MIYPDDDNGDTLRRMEAEGDDLTKPRNIDFTVVFLNEDLAKRFAGHFQQEGYNVSVDFAQTVKELPWDVVVVRYMSPSYQEINDFETELQEAADLMGGRNDGWGCFSESNKHPQ
jgi:hypothetical protein